MSNLYGLLGEKLTHSFSPQIHSMIFEEININGYYHLFEVKKENLEEAVNAFKVLQLSGINVTIPYKLKVMRYLDEISDEARKIGAVNTVVIRDNKSIGYNTDYYGFGMMLDSAKITINNSKAVILGTGGASKAVEQYLIDNGISEITYVTRDKIKNKMKDYKTIQYEELKDLKNQDIIINCTPCGMFPHIDECPVDSKILINYSAAVDLIYNPKQTKFLQYASDKGMKTINGLYMLVAQAVKAEELWVNKSISTDIVDKIYNKLSKIIYE